MSLLKVSDPFLKVVRCPRHIHRKNMVNSQKPVARIQTTELEIDKSVEKNANMKRRKELMDRLENRNVSPSIKMIDPVSLIREDRI